ncbi:HVO_0649 family zinc finger protein [Haloplanus sp. HW8-1]|jgi:ribosomal protein L34E|uniref:HVO_0649 family zinc finger protein n=1 Tax=Haloplanus pelagicus TaxID=2949995 RepID=UPI002041C11B|nr:HVO_0649 family zinc finger protein [Haloplanus sp. HW8-1]
MSMKDRSASTPFGRLRAHYEESRAACPACGHEDREVEWRVTAAAGRRVEYRHRCPSCDAVDTRELSL